MDDKAAAIQGSLLTIKIENFCKNPPVSAVEPSPYNSPSLVSPPSSAFVSALQSPYISPRALTPNPKPIDDSDGGGGDQEASALPSSEDLPSSSYTPPSDHYEFSDGPADAKIKFLDPGRISFSFPVPRISFTKCPVVSSPASANTKLRSCDVYVGFHGQTPNLMRFCKWLKSELELQGIACFVADRAKYSDNQSHEIADRVICSVTFGIVVITNASFANPLTMEEIRFFTQKKNLIPVLFETGSDIDKLIKSNEFKIEANESNWRGCVTKAATLLRSKLGRTSVAEKEIEAVEEIPFLRNRHFVGREREMMEIEAALFGCGDSNVEQDTSAAPVEASGKSEGLADEESEGLSTKGGRFISLEIGGKCKEPKLEAWVEPTVVVGRNSLKRTKYKKSKSGKSLVGSSNVICLHGLPGIGKTELALEFAYRYSQMYKMVLWVGGEARYLRQNILNLSLYLGLDLSADAEKDRGRIRSFDEQELEAFKRVKRELFRDIPYLLIIDNLESDSEWWDGKDLHDLIPRNTGGSHVVITTRLSKVMNYDVMPILPLPLSDSMVIMRGVRRTREYPSEELEVLKKFDEKLGRVTFGSWIVGSLLSELGISPSNLLEEVNRVPLDDDFISHVSITDEQCCKNNPFLMKILMFCFGILQQESIRRNLVASKMVLVGSWFAPAPISVSLLAASAKSVAESGNGLGNWVKRLSHSSCLAPKTWKTEEDSATLIVKLGLARRANKAQGYWVHFHPITRVFGRRKEGSVSAKAMVQGIRKTGTPLTTSDHLWASAFLVFGFKSEPPLVQLKAIDMVLYIKKTALPLAIRAFTGFSRCSSALELLKVCTNVLEEVEKSFVSQVQDWCHGSLCWKKSQSNLHGAQKVDEFVWQDVTLLKATLLETRAKLLLRGGHFDSGEELCRTCISIRTVMLGHNHAQTLAAQETLAKLVRMRSKI